MRSGLVSVQAGSRAGQGHPSGEAGHPRRRYWKSVRLAWDRTPLDEMDLTVAICTWNRCDLLAQTLERMASVLVVPPGLAWELLIVDNGSVDATPEVIVTYRNRLPIRALDQPRQGLSWARNLAVSEAAGTYIVWTDDDVLVQPNWLGAYVSAFSRRPEAAVFGGPIEPWFPNVPPSWLREAWSHVAGAYAAIDFGPDEQPLSHDRLPYGANMAMRLEELRRYPFDVALGHRGHEKIGAEETFVMRDLLAAGAEGWWVPEARVEHFIPPDRQTPAYLRSYYFGRGQRLLLDHYRAGAEAWSVPAVAQLVAWEGVYWLARSLGASTVWVRALRRSWIARGFLKGLADHRAPRRRGIRL